MRSHHSLRLSHLLLVLIIGLSAMYRADARFAVQPINSVTGDRSFMERFGVPPDGNTDEDLRISTHLAYVERRLRSRDADGLPAELRRARTLNLDRLHEYLVHGIFPRNYDYPGRRPCFIDRDGRICAVGYLVEQSAGRAAAGQINMHGKYERITEIRSVMLEQWLKASGLTLEEAAMIQPEYDHMRATEFFNTRSAYERPDVAWLNLRGYVQRVRTREPKTYSDAQFDRQGFINQSMTVGISEDGSRDTVHTLASFQGRPILRTTIHTWRPGPSRVMRETIEYHPATFDLKTRRPSRVRSQYSLFVSVQDDREHTDSARVYGYDSLGRLIAISRIHAGESDSTKWRISYDTLTRRKLPVAWMTLPLVPARKDATRRLHDIPTNARVNADAASTRILERRVLNGKRGGEEWIVWDGLGRRVLYRPLHKPHRGPFRMVVCEYDRNRNVTHELTIGSLSEEDLLQGYGKPLRDVTNIYAFDDKGNWIRREQTIAIYENGTSTSTTETVERTIEYWQ